MAKTDVEGDVATTAADWLREHGAHHDVVEWASGYGERWDLLWEECPRGDWLLALAARVSVDRAALVRAACACARTCLDLVPANEARPERAVREAELWLEGGGSAERCASAGRDAAAVDSPDMAVAVAAAAASDAAATVVDPERASMAAGNAVQAAILSVGDCAMMTVAAHTQRATADAVREHVPWEAVRDALALRGARAR